MCLHTLHSGPRLVLHLAHRLALLGVVLLTALAATDAGAHSGRLTMAAGIDSITVDGDLGDWPAYLPRYPITNAAFGDPPQDESDVSASFRVAYPPGSSLLYVAVEVRDESIVTPDSLGDPERPGAWMHADGCELYLDVTHGGAPPVQVARYGRHTVAFGPPSLLTGQQRSDVDFEVAFRTVPGGRVYEWQVDLATVGDGVRLQSGVDIGFDVAVEDRDADGSFTWLSWGPDTDKLTERGRLGDLLAVASGQSMGEAIASSNLLGRTVQRAESEARRSALLFSSLAGALLAATALHLLLFLFQRETRVNLYYALFSGGTGLCIGLLYLASDTPGFGRTGWLVPLWVVFVYAASLLLLYTQFHGRVSATGRVLLAGLVYAAVIRALPTVGVTVPPILSALASLFLVAPVLTIAALVAGAVKRRRDGAWSVGVSFLVLALSAAFIIYQTAAGRSAHPAVLLGIAVPMAAMSFRLARSVGRVHRDLARRYEEVESLSARLQQQNREVAEANRLKTDFLARMSHDLRTPLNAIIGYTRILLRRLQGGIDDRQYRNLENIRISADNLLALINDILDLSRIESGRVEVQAEEVDVARLAAECTDAVASLVPRGVELTTSVPEELTLSTDTDRLRRVLMNLVGNAVKYTEAGSIRVQARRDGDVVELTVSDTGVGIPEADLPHIFDEFRQVDRKDRRREGSGLGLAIARRSVEVMGGTIAAASDAGQGSTFTVRLPASPPTAGPAPETAAPETGAAAPRQSPSQA